MSAHQIERRRIRPVPRRRRTDLRRVALWFAAIAGMFAIAFGIGHIRRGGEVFAESTPPRLSAVPSPVPDALASAPAIKLAVVRRPPPAKSTTPTNGSREAVTPTVTTVTPVTPVTPAASSPEPEATTSPTPSSSKPAPTKSSSPPTHSSGGSGSGSSGTSFESSG
jgi:hypothetical protein